jgi:hypothetical protein
MASKLQTLLAQANAEATELYDKAKGSAVGGGEWGDVGGVVRWGEVINGRQAGNNITAIGTPTED